MLDFKGKAKWDAWNSIKVTTSEEARAKYIKLVKSILLKVAKPPEEDLLLVETIQDKL